MTQLSTELETLIRQHVSFGKVSPAGFETCTCAVCSDYKERGAFKFEGGGSIGYHCFNCGHNAFFDGDAKKLGKKFIAMLADFGIPEDQVKLLRAKYLISTGQTRQEINAAVAETIEKYSPPKDVDPPPDLHMVETDTSPWCEVAREYLRVERGLAPGDYDFFVSEDKWLEGRMIMLFWHGDRLIYWQARSMDDSIDPRYKNPVVDKEKIIFNYDELLHGPTVEPLFVTEGAIDAISIGKRACAINGSSLSEWQFNELKKVARKGRKLIFIIDPDDNGHKLGLQVLGEDYHIAMLPEGVGDANKARKRFGKLWLLNHLTSTAVTGFAGKLLLQARCEKKKPTNGKSRKATTPS